MFMTLKSLIFILESIHMVIGFPTYVSNNYEDNISHSSVANDHHGGISIVGAGGSNTKGITFDLTKETGQEHKGLFGGSFVSHDRHHGISIGQPENEEHGKELGHNEGLGSYSSSYSSYDASNLHNDFDGAVDSEIIAGLDFKGHDNGHGSSYSTHESVHDSHTHALLHSH